MTQSFGDEAAEMVNETEVEAPAAGASAPAGAASASDGEPTPEPTPEPVPLPRGLALRIGVLSLARYLAVLAQFWTVAAGVGIGMTFFQIAAAAPLGQLAGMAGFTPGALGIQEAGWVGAFTWVGLDAVSIGLFVLSQRLIITAYFSLLSLLSWLLLRRTRVAASVRA